MYNMTWGILLSQFLVQNKTNYISFKSSPHAEHNGTSHSFIPPITAVKKAESTHQNLCIVLYMYLLRIQYALELVKY